MKKKAIPLAPLLSILLVLAALLLFMSGLNHLRDGRQSEGRQQLEDALRRAAVSCYAAEGIYPPNIEYLEEHYGIQIDREHYTVVYEVFASNLMPDVTVLER